MIITKKIATEKNYQNWTSKDLLILYSKYRYKIKKEIILHLCKITWALLIWITLGWFLEAWYRFDSCLQVPGSCIHASALWIWERCLSTCKTENNWEATLIIFIYYFVFNSIYETKILKMEIWTRLFLTTRWWNLQMKWTFLLLEGKKHFINLTFS